MSVLTTPVYGLGYISPDHPLNQLAEASQTLAEKAEAALVRGGVAPPASQDLAALAGRVTQLEGERAWTAYASTSYSTALTTTGGAVPPGFSAAQGTTATLTLGANVVPAGRLLDVEVRIPLLNVAANSSAYLRLVDSVSGVLDGVQVTAAAAAVAAPARLRGDTISNGAARTVQLQAWYSGASASFSASTGAFAPVLMRYRVI